jgi:hypothetical protein
MRTGAAEEMTVFILSICFSEHVSLQKQVSWRQLQTSDFQWSLTYTSFLMVWFIRRMQTWFRDSFMSVFYFGCCNQEALFHFSPVMDVRPLSPWLTEGGCLLRGMRLHGEEESWQHQHPHLVGILANSGEGSMTARTEPIVETLSPTCAHSSSLSGGWAPFSTQRNRVSQKLSEWLKVIHLHLAKFQMATDHQS